MEWLKASSSSATSSPAAAGVRDRALHVGPALSRVSLCVANQGQSCVLSEWGVRLLNQMGGIAVFWSVGTCMLGLPKAWQGCDILSPAQDYSVSLLATIPDCLQA